MENPMNTLNDFEIKQRKYIPVFPKANGKPTIYIDGYPCEDDEPMAATAFHGLQINILFDQLSRYMAINELIYIGVDSFIYYEEGNISKCVAPDIYIVFGVEKYPLRRSFYTWKEGAVPVAVIEFLSDATAHQDRTRKVELYLKEIGVQEYFIHQPEMEKPVEFRGWQRTPSGDIVEIEPDAEGGLFSEALNLWLRWEDDQTTHVRLLRPYLPDGTPIDTSMEIKHELEHEKNLREEEQLLREQEQHHRREAEALAAAETEKRQKAEALAKQEAARRKELERELEQFRAQNNNL